MDKSRRGWKLLKLAVPDKQIQECENIDLESDCNISLNEGVEAEVDLPVIQLAPTQHEDLMKSEDFESREGEADIPYETFLNEIIQNVDQNVEILNCDEFEDLRDGQNVELGSTQVDCSMETHDFESRPVEAEFQCDTSPNEVTENVDENVEILNCDEFEDLRDGQNVELASTQVGCSREAHDSKRFEEFVDNELNDEISDLDLSDDDDADPDFQLIDRGMGAEEPSSSDDENEDDNSMSQNLTESVTSQPSSSDSRPTETAEPLQRASRTRRNTRDSIGRSKFNFV
ncbi:hypothetical protein LSTR_LSTR003964 [Laodelphax striatellus]|uniref:Uncharacterized protein n=1 Tax=Laodelphax striatellus TaxID=195883 RepID=A0A482WFY5_LAOST|nr:hypothetical protein LSTR_LSTR003964 [Laodelphax striatellus]